MMSTTIVSFDGLPVCHGHALEQFGQRSINRDVRGAGLPEVIRLARLSVDGVEVVSFLRRVLDVRRRHHEVSTVDDLGFPSVRLYVN